MASGSSATTIFPSVRVCAVHITQVSLELHPHKPCVPNSEFGQHAKKLWEARWVVLTDSSIC